MSEFRQAVEPVQTEVKPIKTAPVEKTSEAFVQVPDLVATYEAEQGKPYVAKYYDIENVWDAEPGLKRDMQEIEGFIRDRVTKGELENSTKATDTYLQELERKAGLTRYESTNQRITKLLAYIDFIRTVEK